MATFNIEPMQIASGNPTIVHEPEAAGTQAFKRGQLVYLVAGLVTEVASNGVVIYGMAMHDASGTTSTDCEIALISEDTILRGTVYEDGGGTNDTIAVADKGVKYAVVVVGDHTCVDTGDTGYDALVIVGFIDAVGDIYPKVLFKVLPEAIQGGAAAS
jgi:hypothetical protein